MKPTTPDHQFPLVGLVRAARRRADMSQRELARQVGVSRSTIGRIEDGSLTPSLGLFHRILTSAALRLVVIDIDDRLVAPMQDREDIRDGAERRYPSHLDTILDPRHGEWWGDRYGLARPPETYRRSKAHRDAQRRYSQWDVRVAQHRHEPPPPNPAGWPDTRWR